MENRFFYISEFPTKTRLDSFLVLKTSKSRTCVKRQILSGNVLVNGKIAKKAGQVIRYGDRIEATFENPIEIKATPIEGNIDVIYEDEDLIAINKPAGLVVHPSPTYKAETLVNHLLYYFRNDKKFPLLSDIRPGIVHRLDKGTTGVLLVAKNEKSHEKLSKQFKDRKVIKIYESIVWGRTKKEGFINLPIGRSIKDRKKMSTHITKGKAAQTEWKTLATFKHFSYLKLMPKTGRTHQLRVHLTEMGHPIVGDMTYKKKLRETLNPMIEIALGGVITPLLHAKEITFSHPNKNISLTISAPLPSHFTKILSLLKKFDH